MIALNLLESATLNTPRFFRRYEGEADNEVSMDKLIVVTGGEGRLLNERFSGSAETGDEAASETEKQVGKLRAAGEEALLSWEPFPARIGRVSTRYRGNAVLFHEEPAPLADQLEALRERKPGKRHFRIAVINGFGGNLGDNIVGMTAMREAAKVLGEHLPSFSVDILFGPDNREACADLLLHEPWMERISYLAPTVREFASYDAYFDFLNLITSPKYNTMPSTDWYLWWLGLDPVAVPVGNKRNRMALRWKEWHEVETLLRKAGGTKRVLFNPKASVPLRSMPEDVAVKLVKQLLDLDTSLSIVLDRPLPMEHRRVFSLGDAITSPELHKALVAQMQGVISVNTLTPHAADAASVPCVQLCTVYPPEMYPYYRYARNLNVPGFETLPAFRRPKVSEEEWKGMEAAYHEAWKGVKAKTVLASLNEAMRRREEAEREPQGLTLVHGIHERRCVTEGADPAFLHERETELWTFSQQRLEFVTKSLLRSGMTVVLAGAGRAKLCRHLLETVGACGTLHVFEPRRLRARLVFGALAGYPNAEFHTTVPLSGAKQAEIPEIDPWSETDPLSWGNTTGKRSVPIQSVDALSLRDCHMLIVQPPLPSLSVLQGCLETLKRCRPVLLVSAEEREKAGPLCREIMNSGYTFWGQPALKGDGSRLLLIGTPNEKETELAGFAKITVD